MVVVDIVCKKANISNKVKRCVCRSGAGVEQTAGKCDTPGFQLRKCPQITRDLRGYNRFELPRNCPRSVQTSLWLAQGRRANCDIQVILYDTDPNNPDPAEIAVVTDYMVSYSTKG